MLNRINIPRRAAEAAEHVDRLTLRVPQSPLWWKNQVNRRAEQDQYSLARFLLRIKLWRTSCNAHSSRRGAKGRAFECRISNKEFRMSKEW